VMLWSTDGMSCFCMWVMDTADTDGFQQCPSLCPQQSSWLAESVSTIFHFLHCWQNRSYYAENIVQSSDGVDCHRSQWTVPCPPVGCCICTSHVSGRSGLVWFSFMYFPNNIHNWTEFLKQSKSTEWYI
jgi:hypothetical protein